MAFFRIFRKPHIGCDFGANLAPFSFPKSMNILPKIDPKMHQFFDRFGDGFFIDLDSILKANLGPCWPLKSIRNCPRRPQDAPRTPPRRPQDAAKTPQDSPRRPKDTPRRAQDAPRRPKTRPRRLQDAPRRDFQWMLGARMEPCWYQKSHPKAILC